jgi:hypothetical protein
LIWLCNKVCNGEDKKKRPVNNFFFFQLILFIWWFLDAHPLTWSESIGQNCSLYSAIPVHARKLESSATTAAVSLLWVSPAIWIWIHRQVNSCLHQRRTNKKAPGLVNTIILFLFAHFPKKINVAQLRCRIFFFFFFFYIYIHASFIQ